MPDRPTALVTGGARRIGKFLVEHLAKEGWEVIIHYNQSCQSAQQLSEKLQQLYPDRHFPLIQLELKNWEVLEQQLSFIDKLTVKVDLLVNNASTFNPSSLLDGSIEHIKSQFGINAFAPMVLGQFMVKKYHCKHIINMLDTDITTNRRSHTYYLLAKKVLHEHTRMAAAEWGPQVRVNGIAPGPVLPPDGHTNDYLDNAASHLPLQKTVSLNTLSRALDFLLEAEDVTGQIVFCDSGSHVK
jgi:NAD(P)-dependent dehydrogenase (short-subunit alcohol dehydrogenase family)